MQVIALRGRFFKERFCRFSKQRVELPFWEFVSESQNGLDFSESSNALSRKGSGTFTSRWQDCFHLTQQTNLIKWFKELKIQPIFSFWQCDSSCTKSTLQSFFSYLPSLYQHFWDICSNKYSFVCVRLEELRASLFFPGTNIIQSNLLDWSLNTQEFILIGHLFKKWSNHATVMVWHICK